jgi:hypothetical protein
MLTWNIPVIVAGRWVQAKIVCDHGNKYEAYAQYKEEQAAKGVEVKGYDMGNAWMQWN